MEEVRGLVRALRDTPILLCIQVRKPLRTRGTGLSGPVHIIPTQITNNVVLVITTRVIFSGLTFLMLYDPHFVFWTRFAVLCDFVPVWLLHAELMAAPADTVLGELWTLFHALSFLWIPQRPVLRG